MRAEYQRCTMASPASPIATPTARPASSQICRLSPAGMAVSMISLKISGGSRAMSASTTIEPRKPKMAQRNGRANAQALRITRPSMLASFTASLSRGSMVWGPIRICSRRLRPAPNLPTGARRDDAQRPAGRASEGRAVVASARCVEPWPASSPRSPVLAACSDKRPELTLRRPPVSGVPSSTIAVPSSTAAPTTPAPTTTLVGAPAPAVSWQACGEGLECGTMTVLLDHADATKGTIDLYVERRKALKPDQRIGTLLVNPGGPGVAGTQLVEQASFYFSQALRDRFDIVSWDPRGTGRSIPLDCVDDLDPFLIGADPTPDSPEDQQQAAALATAFVTGCQTRSGPTAAVRVDPGDRP